MTQKIFLFGLLYSILFIPSVLIAAEPVQVAEETARSISFKVDVPEPVFATAGDTHGSACSIEGFSLYHVPGMPGVVLRGVMVAIPPGSSVDINVAVHSSQDFKNIDLAPVPTLHSDGSINGGDDSFDFVKDLNVYRSNEYFPAQFAEVANTGVLRGTHFAQVRITPLQYNPVQRIVRVARSMTVTLTFAGSDTTAASGIIPNERLASPVGRVFDTIRAASIINPGSDFIPAGREKVAYPAMAQLSAELQDSPFAIKIVTSAPGIHRVRYEDISGLGVDLSGLTNSNIKVENLGHEIAVYRSGTGLFESGDYILFYAEDFQSEYSSTNVYWLYQGAGSGLSMQTAGSAPDSGYTPPEFFIAVERFEQNLVWRRNLPDYVDGEDQWFWRLLKNSGVKTLDMPFTLNNFDNDTGFFDIEFYVRGLTPSNHRTRLVLNGTQIDDFEWTGTAIERRTVSGISSTLFNTGLNTLTVQALTATGNEPTTPPDEYYVNWAELTYARRYVADANRLAFGADTSGGTTFEVSGFSEPEIMVFDVRETTAPVLLTDTSISTEDDVSRVRFEVNVENSSAFYALIPGSSLMPDSMVVDTPSDLRSLRTDIDYIIIAHNQFLAEVEDLKTIREQGGLSVEIVDVQDIYDEFSYGIKDVTAIKDFLRYAYSNWHATDHPTYVVLVGDATYDYRDNLGLASLGKADLVPTYLGYRGSLGSSVGATASDNWFVSVDGDDPLPDMVIGRLCVKTIQDLQNIIDKIETYENSLPDEWHSRVLFAADTDDQNIFEYMTASLSSILPAAYTDLRLYLREYGSGIATATEDLIEAISNGALITNYIGHGSTDTWSKRTWFQTPNQNTGLTRDDVAQLTNAGQYTFLLVLNCLSGTFSEVTDDYCMAEEFVRQQQRGAVTCVAPSASGLPSQHSVLGQSMYENLFNEYITAGGALLTVSKIEAYQQTSSRDILETFNFLGDPALKLNIAIPESDLTISKATVKAGKDEGGDSIELSGILNATAEDLDAAVGGTLIVSLSAVYIPGDVIEYEFPIEAENVKNGKYTSLKDQEQVDPETKLEIDTNKGTIKFSAKKDDLTGLSCPITVRIEILGWWAEEELEEDIVNGNKPCPLSLLMFVNDSLEVTDAKVNKSTKPDSDSVSISGTFTIEGSFDKDEPVTITIGSNTFTVPGAEFVEKNGAYKCKQAESGNGLVTATFDSVKATYKISIKNADLSTGGAFSIDIFGNLLNAADPVPLP